MPGQHDAQAVHCPLNRGNSILPTDIVLFRVGASNRPLRPYLTFSPPPSEIAARIAFAIPCWWVDPQTGVFRGASTIDTVFAIRIPAGTTVYIGPVAGH